MAIQFARCEYVSRSSGGNACRKASYNQREEVRCERTGQLFSFKERGGNVHHEIFLPGGANEKFKNSEVLWNEAERCEKRKDSQVAKEFVIALPDNKEITLEDRIELTQRFGHLFIERGVAVQIDVHAPHEREKNWHAHLLVTTRRFSEDGMTFYEKKATDLDPVIRSKVVVEADLWGEVWRDLQNAFFEEKGYDIKVDPIGLVPQEHLGPVRMRHHLNEAVLRAQLLEKANEKLAKDPKNILEEMTRTQAIFKKKDVEVFLQKHVPFDKREGLLEKTLQDGQVLPLYDKETQKETGYFTTQAVREEEEKLLRFTDSIAKRSAIPLSDMSIEKGVKGKSLSDEQRKSYDLCVNSEKNLILIQGRAGVGKSYLLNAIRIAHAHEGYRILGLAPTNKLAQDLRNDGFEAKTCHSFLFAFKNNRETLDSNTLVVVDEASMLGTTLSVELFNVIKNKGAKLILVGDDRQLSSVERGGPFRFLSERYGAAELSEVRRQTIGWQKEVSEALAENDTKKAIDLLENNKAISWNRTKEESLSNLLKDWGKEMLINPHETRQIIAQKNTDVDALNQGARDILRQAVQLGETEIICSTQRGRLAFAEGDRIHLTETDKSQGLTNGMFGRIEKINSQTKQMILHLDNGETKTLNPDTYNGLRHGYAATVYRTQGATLSSVYVLHSRTTNQPTNYVALTRQTKSLSLYVSQEKTPSAYHLISQMGRRQEKGTSLVFDILKDIEKRNEPKTFLAPVKETAETLLTKIKDKFHKNEAFYQFEKEQTPQEPATLASQKDDSKNKDHQRIFEKLTTNCEQQLHAYITKENISLTSKIRERIPLQAERAASFIFYAHIIKGTEPTEKETKLFLLRAKYELDRIHQIKEELTEKWQERGTFDKQKDPLIVHMIAERRVSLEGRLFFEAKQAGHNPLSNIAQQAEKEFNTHKAHTKPLAQKLKDQYSLSETESLECAKNIMRYHEIHGEKPTNTQRAAMAEISRQLGEKHLTPVEKEVGSHNLAYLRRMNGDHMFQEHCYKERHAIAQERELMKIQQKAALEAQRQREVEREALREKDRGFEMGM